MSAFDHNYSIIWSQPCEACGGRGVMARSAKNYELAIAALAGALAMMTFLFLWERSSIEAAAKSADAARADRSSRARTIEPLWPYQRALGLLPPDEQDLNDGVGPIESDSPYDVFSPYLHKVPANRPAAPAPAPRPTRSASLQPSAPKPSAPLPTAAASDFWVPDVSSLLVPVASLAMLAIPLAEFERAQYSKVTVWSPAPVPSSDAPGLSGPFHLFFTTDSPTGVAPVAETGGAGLTSSTTSTVTNAVSSTTSSLMGLASSTTSSLTGLESSTTSAATSVISSTTSTVSSILHRH
jgi:hypothetical protein